MLFLQILNHRMTIKDHGKLWHSKILKLKEGTRKNFTKVEINFRALKSIELSEIGVPD